MKSGFKHHMLYASLLLAMPHFAIANDTNVVSGSLKEQENEAATTLQTINVKARGITRKTEETTGLGKSVKNSDDLNKAQILSIRDLVRDTPGIGVVEQGRGASSGYAMRGVDKNRVAVMVDGIPQLQSYVAQKREGKEEGSGAINEMELENVSSVQFSQGASSSESGSGSLGGAVSFRTKTVDDYIQAGKNTGISYKTSYSSKDGQRLHSLGGAFRLGGFEGLVQYTHRTKHETEAHDDVNKVRYEVERYAGYPEDFADGSAKLSQISGANFMIGSECPTFNSASYETGLSSCKPSLKQKAAALDAPQRKVEYMDAKSYTGNKRVMSDPMDYRSESWLARLGYRFSPEHSIDTILERTTQKYDTRDMTLTAYHLADLTNPTSKGALAGSRGFYRGNAYSEGLNNMFDDNTPVNIRWTQARYFDEHHDKKRYGISYRYQSRDNPILDSATLSFDSQNISIDHREINKWCSPYPYADRNCQVGLNKPGSAEQSHRKIYDEKHRILRADFNKTFETQNGIRNRVNLGAGLDKFSSNLWIGDLHDAYAKLNFKYIGEFIHPDDIGKPSGSRKRVDVYEPTLEMEHIRNNCEGRTLVQACGNRLIKGNNLYFSGRNTLSIKNILDISTGLRFDRHVFRTDDTWTGSGRYQNWSWNLGFELKPIDDVSILYRVSSGYRVPSFKELFGYRVAGYIKGTHDRFHYVTDVQSERALNREWGLVFKPTWGRLEASYFDNQYRDLIDETLKDGKLGYRNFQDARVAGITLRGNLDLHALWQKLPDGLNLTFNYGHSKVKANNIKPGFEWGRGYFMDSISPARYVISLDYTHPSDKWGVGMVWTASKAKKASELSAVVQSPSGGYVKEATDALPAKAWRTLDISAFYRPFKYLTVRGAVYNVANRGYIQWEALRQTSITSGNQHTQGLPAQYAAPGRNFVLSLEARF
ncbi:MAG: lactoferrin/transferrin family TonB-dependent receptor [Alysiella sp.]|uniref:lactoferrin/transferrin family TonB-dependent receptor n=1 Tax=Alysiella sp. TaxID=1872483 RepID=UPI0026DAFA17|nr:lactoferrin/transferrin family TonB-dependent receptor [Alysiella sp.]MDO4434095.1 lactoferrin/transferrin family TonB-dependent receptor [Alysiella sp.]